MTDETPNAPASPRSSFARLESAFHSARDLPPAARPDYLDRVCEGDDELRRALESLLATVGSGNLATGQALGLAANLAGDPQGTLQTGQVIGPYRIGPVIGVGGMGAVYRARDTKLERDVAVKILPRAFAEEPERRARFEREARALAALSHPHIAHIHGVEEAPLPAGGGVVRGLILELVDGDTLAERLQRGRPPLTDVLRFGSEIASALEAAHDRGIVHRDLKPANIKVTAGGAIKVLDFGLAKTHELAEGETALATGDGVLLGTPAYMSPEQARGRTVDRRTDIWAFGAVLFEMLTGTRAFHGDGLADTIVSVLGKEPEWSRLPEATPAPVRSLLRRCLDKDVHRRLRDIGEARILLGDVMANRVEPQSPVAASPPAGRSLFRRALPALLTGMVMSLVGFVAWPRSAPGGASPNAIRFVIPLGDDWPFVRMAGRMLAVSRDGRYLVHIGHRQLYLRPLGAFDSNLIAGSAGTDAADPFFSSDGEWVGFYSVADQTVKKIPVNGGTAVTVATAGGGFGAFQGGDWVGDEILFATVGKGIMRVSAAGSEPEVVIPVARPAQPFGPQRLPGGAIMFALAADEAADRWDAAQVVVVTPAGVRKTILRGGSAPRYLSSGHLVYVVGDTLKAVAFDLDRLEITGAPVDVIDDVRRTNSLASGAAQFAISDTGHIAYIPGAVTPAEQHPTTLWLQREDGTTRRLGLPAAPYAHPRISPDGRRFAVSTPAATGQPESIWVGDLGPAPSLRRLTVDSNGRWPVWSRDSDHVLYVSDREGEPGVFRQPADGGPAVRLFQHANLRKIEAIHPDGRTLLVQMAVGFGKLGVVTPDGAYVPVVNRPGSQFGGAFSPDGRWLAYANNNGGLTQVMVEPYPETGARHQVSTTSGARPLWAPDGRRLYFHTSIAMGEVDRLASVRVRDSSRFSFDTEIPVETAGAVLGPRNRDFDIMPDGRTLLLLRPLVDDSRRTPKRQQINVVLHFADELKQRVIATR